MKKYRISTTISSEHYKIFKKHMGEFDSQQRLLEYALENLDNSMEINSRLSPEEELWLRMYKDYKNGAVVFQKEMLKVLAETADVEQYRKFAMKNRPFEFVIEYIYQRPLKECSLQEIFEGLIHSCKLQNTYETINYTDEGDHYMFKMTHSWGINHSRVVQIFLNCLFESYGARIESRISEQSIFTKVFKKV